MSNSKITSLESYLAQIAHELRDLPAQTRADELREIESHLTAMIGQRGDVAAVLAQFGAPRVVGRDLRRAWERKQPESWINAMLAFTLGCLFVSGHNYFWFNILDGVPFFFRPSFYYFFIEGFGSFVQTFFAYFLAESLLTLIAGAGIGFVSPKRGKMAILLFFPFLVLLDFYPLISAGTGFYFVSFFMLLKYTVLLLCLLTGARFGARRGRKRSVQMANSK